MAPEETCDIESEDEPTCVPVRKRKLSTDGMTNLEAPNSVLKELIEHGVKNGAIDPSQAVAWTERLDAPAAGGAVPACKKKRYDIWSAPAGYASWGAEVMPELMPDWMLRQLDLETEQYRRQNRMIEDAMKEELRAKTFRNWARFARGCLDGVGGKHFFLAHKIPPFQPLIFEAPQATTTPQTEQIAALEATITSQASEIARLREALDGATAGAAAAAAPAEEKTLGPEVVEVVHGLLPDVVSSAPKTFELTPENSVRLLMAQNARLQKALKRVEELETAGGGAAAPAAASAPAAKKADAPPGHAVVTSVDVVVPETEKGSAAIAHVVLETDLEVLEGQSVSVLPPGVDEKTGKPHKKRRLYTVASERGAGRVDLCVRKVQGRKRVIKRRFNVGVPRARVPKKDVHGRDRSER